MCGLAGSLSFDGRGPERDLVERMVAALERRGPDGGGAWAHGPLALGHRRLKVIDLSDAGAQPMVDDELRLAVVFNGCIYNYADLRSELRECGYRFRSQSDTEVLLKAYHRWGAGFVERLNGMFAFCIAELESGRIVLGRDRLGIKPLYIARTPGALRFASSLPALLAGGGIDTEIDGVALHHYLTFHSVVPAPHTILRGVSRLPAATVLTVESDGSEAVTEYWHPRFARRDEDAAMDADEWSEAVLDCLRAAVRRRLTADVPVGVLLSGGLDSSLIVALLAEAGRRPQTFSIGFEAAGLARRTARRVRNAIIRKPRDAAWDEFRYSDEIARRFQTDHHRIRLPARRLFDALPDAVAAMSEPMLSMDIVAWFLLSQEVSAHVKVVQSGQGADEIFGGYHWYPPLLEESGTGAAAYASVFFDRSHAALEALLTPEHLPPGDPSGEFVERHFAQPGADTALDRALRIDTRCMLTDDPLKRVDNMTMAWGVEARLPFLDHELVELAAACPPQLKIAHGGKGVLKQAARQLLPAAVIDRPKGYFPVPGLTRLGPHYVELFREALESGEARTRGLFRRDSVDRLLADPNAELTPMGINLLWQIALLELWLQAHV